MKQHGVDVLCPVTSLCEICASLPPSHYDAVYNRIVRNERGKLKTVGQTEDIVLPYSELLEDGRAQLQTRMVLKLIKEANDLGLEGKRLTELVSSPTFSIADLRLSMKWEKELQ